MKDREYAEDLNQKLDSLVAEYTKKAADIYSDVFNRL